MHDYRNIIEGQIDPNVVLFFALFSRTEFALKRGGFLVGQVGGSAEPDWNNFAAALGTGLYNSLAAAPESNILFSQPPKRLVVQSANEVKFVKPDDIKNLQMLFEAVRRVRNNLFHGEKVNLSPRDRDLMEASVYVLNTAMNACDAVPQCKKVPIAFMFAQVPGYP